MSLMVEGRIAHEGSLEHGQELRPFDVQVQRAGGEGFMHNEVNPDPRENRMIQFWALPETPGEPAGYRLYRVEPGERRRVYGGNDDQAETFAARTVIEVARPEAQQSCSVDAACFVYLVSGAGHAGEQALREGHMVLAEAFDYVATEDSLLILVRYQQP